MDGGMDGRVYGWVDGLMNESVDGRIVGSLTD